MLKFWGLGLEFGVLKFWGLGLKVLRSGSYDSKYLLVIFDVLAHHRVPGQLRNVEGHFHMIPPLHVQTSRRLLTPLE